MIWDTNLDAEKDKLTDPEGRVHLVFKFKRVTNYLLTQLFC